MKNKGERVDQHRPIQNLQLGKSIRVHLVCSLLLVPLALACAPGVSKGKKLDGRVTSCTFAPDQSATFIGTWQRARVPVAVTQDFSANEKTIIAQAFDVWNSHYQAAGGFQAFDYGGSAANFRVVTRSTSPTQDQLCADSNRIIDAAGTAYTGTVVIYKKGADWAYGNQVLALTTSCATVTGTGQLRPFKNAMIELNYKDFYGTGQDRPNLLATVGHEIGHFGGLNHTCEPGSTTAGIPNCLAQLPIDYVRALMFPVVSLNNPVTAINSNDQGRGNCLFSGSWPPR